jgi:hypothetical protein
VAAAAVDPDFSDCPQVSLVDAARFFSSVMRTRAAVQFLSLAQIIGDLQKAKRRNANDSRLESFHLVQHLTGVFYSLRPLMYSHRDKCLLDSLVLVDFLSRYGIFPTLVFGVKLMPFCAHAWVQHDTYVLTSTPWYVQGFQPILAI